MRCHLVLMTGPVPKQQLIPMPCLLVFEQFEDVWYSAGREDAPRPLSQLRFLIEFARPKGDNLAFPPRDSPENKLYTLLTHLSLLWWVLSAYTGGHSSQFGACRTYCASCV